MKPTIPEMIIEYLKKERSWCYGGTLERYVTLLHKPASVSRELRNMAKENLIYKDKELIDSRWVVIYKYKKIK